MVQKWLIYALAITTSELAKRKQWKCEPNIQHNIKTIIETASPLLHITLLPNNERKQVLGFPKEIFIENANVHLYDTDPL